MYLSAGGGFSMMKAPDNYSFFYAGDMIPWPTTIEGLADRRADIGFGISSALEFRLTDLPLTLTAGFAYTQLYGKAEGVKVQSPPWSSTMYTLGELTTRSNIMTFDVGFRWSNLRFPVVPYIGVDLLYTIVGDTKLKIRNDETTFDGTVEGNPSMGLSFGLGVLVPLVEAIDLRVGGNYALMNLLRSDSDEQPINVASFGVSFLCRVH